MCVSTVGGGAVSVRCRQVVWRLCPQAACVAAHVQVCDWASDKSSKAIVTTLLRAAEPWARRRTAALACYSGEWAD